MESTNLSETERVGDVYVVSAETSIDLVKIEPADEYDEDVVVEDDDADYNETASSLATSMYTYTQFNETSDSSSTHFVTSVPSMEAEKIETEFQLKFANESGDKEIKINLLNLDLAYLDTLLII
jgi:hypothetical protein